MSDKDIIPVEGKLTTERQTRIFLMRRSEKRIYDNLTNDMRDAWMEIERAFRLIAGGQGYGSGSDLNRVKGKEEPNYTWQIDQINKYREWARECKDEWRGVVIDLTVFGFSIDEIAFQRAIDKKTVMARFRQGLNVYCINNGMGDQINVD